jgi:predicted kinase
MFRGQDVTSAFGTWTYAPEVTSAVYAELLSRAEDLLATGESVVLDASWIDSARREEARVMASACKSNLIELCCRVHSDTAQNRIVRRLAVGGDPSEATPEVRQAMSEVMDPWSSSIVIDTTGATAEESIGKVGRVVAAKSM